MLVFTNDVLHDKGTVRSVVCILFSIKFILNRIQGIQVPDKLHGRSRTSDYVRPTENLYLDMVYTIGFLNIIWYEEDRDFIEVFVPNPGL